MSSERARRQSNLVGWLATGLLCAAALAQGVALFAGDYEKSCTCKGETDGEDVAVLAIAPRPDSDWEFQPKPFTPAVDQAFVAGKSLLPSITPGDAVSSRVAPRSGPPIYRVAPSNSPPIGHLEV